nr:prolyl 4-hydroxylase subunit alpha-3-like [Procambarus clarkii]XP_045611044.1 prolyl 4-hydroxylase subunit alpha-3-like [Procambarus clarkii]
MVSVELAVMVLSALVGVVSAGHASWTHLHHLHQAELHALQQIRTLLHTFNELNEVLQRYVDSWEAIGGDAGTPPGDPAAAYSLLRHVAGGWTQVNGALHKLKGVFSDIEVLASRADWELLPSGEDVAAASEALVRLVHVYDLNMTMLASAGHFHPHQREINTAPPPYYPLAVSDLASIGLVAVNKGYLNIGVEFLRAARARSTIHAHADGGSLETQFSTQRLDSLLNTAVRVHDHVLEMRGPRSLTHITARTSYGLSQGRVHHLEEENAKEDVVVGVQYLKLHGNKTWMVQERPLVERRQVEMLCRGVELRTSVIKCELHCRYMSNSSPWLLLAPFKVEQLSLDPYITLIYEVLSPREAAEVKERASSQLHTSYTARKGSGHDAPSSEWSLKHAWLEEREVTSLQRLGRRLSQLVGVTLHDSLSEPYRVADSGLGESYEARRDTHGPARSPPNPAVGERMATVLTYLEAPAAGGRTVFPWAGVGVEAVERAAVLWWNLLASHEHDFLTRHAACPVLYGRASSLTKWVGYTGQWQTLPCASHPARKVMLPWR